MRLKPSVHHGSVAAFWSVVTKRHDATGVSVLADGDELTALGARRLRGRARVELDALMGLLARETGRRHASRATLVDDDRVWIARANARLGIPASYGADRLLPRYREPRVLEFAGIDLHDRPQWLAPAAARAFAAMQRAASSDGVDFKLASAFRSAAYQVGIVERKLARGQSIAEILRVSAAPGYSEHHTGRAVDVAETRADSLEESFEKTASFEWLSNDAARYGFRLSYPRGNPHGIAYEPWHWCYDERLSAARSS